MTSSVGAVVSGRAAVSATQAAARPAGDTGLRKVPAPMVRTWQISRIGEVAARRRRIERSSSGGAT